MRALKLHGGAALLLPNQIRARKLAERIRPWLTQGERVLDIGSGHGLVATQLAPMAQVTAVDIRARAQRSGAQQTLFDGLRLPFATTAFDTAMLITVLHHAWQPDTLLAEAARVARRVIVIEDLVENRRERILTQVGDSWLNWQWRNHPHHNRSHSDWLAAYAKQNLTVTHFSQVFHWFVPWRFRHGLYVLAAQPDTTVSRCQVQTRRAVVP